MPKTDPSTWNYCSLETIRKKRIEELIERKEIPVFSADLQEKLEQEDQENGLNDQIFLNSAESEIVRKARIKRTIKAMEEQGQGLIYSVEAEREIKKAVEAQTLQNEIYLELRENKEEKDRIESLKECMKKIKNFKTIKDVQSKWTLYYEFRYFYERYPERVKTLMEPICYEYMGDFHKTLLSFHKNLSQSNVFLSARREEKIQDELQCCKIFGCKCKK